MKQLCAEVVRTLIGTDINVRHMNLHIRQYYVWLSLFLFLNSLNK